LADAHSAFLASLEVVAEPTATGSDTSIFAEDDCRRICESWPPAVEGQNGDDQTYRLACKLRDHGASEQSAYQLMAEVWNPLCCPPWNDGDLWRKVQHAFKYAQNAAGSKTPEAHFPVVMAPPAGTEIKTNVVSMDAHREIKATVFQKALKLHSKSMMPLNTQGNVVYYLKHDPKWAGRIKYNQFADRLEIPGRPDWRRDQLNKDEQLTKTDFAFMQAWFSSCDSVALEVSIDRLEAACEIAAESYHPVRDYLNGLVWDGVQRLDTFLPDTTGCEDNAFTRAAGRCMMIAAVKRIFEPGCKQDYVLILESKQGQKKSTWVETLGGDWYSVGELIPGDKDTYQVLRGKWFIELPEITGTFKTHEHDWIKKIISTGSDTYRPSYARTVQTVKRESVFVATMNPNASCEYLTDDENRRWWPIKTGTFDIERLKRDRDQYFAEAVYRYRQSEKSWIDDLEILALARAEQEARRVTDPWCDMLGEWARSQPPSGFSLTQAFYFLGFSGSQVNSRQRLRLGAALKDLGYAYNESTKKWSRKELTWEDLL